MRLRRNRRDGRLLVDEQNCLIADLERMNRDFEHMALEIGRQIEAEEQSTGIRDKTHFAYSTFAKAATRRRDNLLASAEELRRRIAHTAAERDRMLTHLAEESRRRRFAKSGARAPLRTAVPLLR